MGGDCVCIDVGREGGGLSELGWFTCSHIFAGWPARKMLLGLDVEDTMLRDFSSERIERELLVPVLH
jgi:hypothetical protein